MFGKKKAPLPEGIRLMHYEGLPGFAQDAPCFMEQTAEALVFRRVEGPSVTLPLAKVDSLDIMDERNFAAKYRGTSPNTSRTNAVKWYAVFTYGDKHVAVWFLGGKESKELYALKKQIDSTGQDITLEEIVHYGVLDHLVHKSGCLHQPFLGLIDIEHTKHTGSVNLGF